MVRLKRYEVRGGFNVCIGMKRPYRYAPAKLLQVDGVYELRYEPGLVIAKADVPAHTAWDWLVNRGSLVELPGESEA